MTPTLSEVETGMAMAAHERRHTARLTAAGLAVFISTEAVRQYPKPHGSGTATVLPFTVYAGQRAALISCEVSRPELIELVVGLVEGEVVRLSGQLVSVRVRFGCRVRLRVGSIERASLRDDPPSASV